VPIGYERLASGGDECDAILIRLDLFRDTDTHENSGRESGYALARGDCAW
jgi:nucleoside 2-deoxyribosyltransferase